MNNRIGVKAYPIIFSLLFLISIGYNKIDKGKWFLYQEFQIF